MAHAWKQLKDNLETTLSCSTKTHVDLFKAMDYGGLITGVKVTDVSHEEIKIRL